MQIEVAADGTVTTPDRPTIAAREAAHKEYVAACEAYEAIQTAASVASEAAYVVVAKAESRYVAARAADEDAARAARCAARTARAKLIKNLIRNQHERH